MEEILSMKKLMEEDRPVSWDNLPDIDLYMDQVVGYLSRQAVGGKAPAITSAMINNYVKDGLLPRACGKRYHREHLVYLTAVGVLKNVLTVKDMKLLLEQAIVEGQEQSFYAHFLERVDEAFRGTNTALDENLEEDSLAEAALVFALYSCAAKTVCEQEEAKKQKEQKKSEESIA